MEKITLSNGLEGRGKREFNVGILEAGKGASLEQKIEVADELMAGEIDRVDGSIEGARARMAPYTSDVVEQYWRGFFRRSPGINERGRDAIQRTTEGYLREQIGRTWSGPSSALHTLAKEAEDKERNETKGTPPWRVMVCHPHPAYREDLTDCLSQWPGPPGLTGRRLEVIPCSGVEEIPEHCEGFSGRIIALVEIRREHVANMDEIMRTETMNGAEWFFLNSLVDEDTAPIMVDAMLDGRAIGVALTPNTRVGLDLDVGVAGLYNRFVFDNQANRVYRTADPNYGPPQLEGRSTLGCLANALLREPPSQWSNLDSFHARLDEWSRDVLNQRFNHWR